MIGGPVGVGPRPLEPAAGGPALFVAATTSGPVRAVAAVGRVEPVRTRLGLGRFADALNQASAYAAESGALRARWPDGRGAALPPSAPAAAALAGLATDAPSRGPVIIEGRPSRAAASAASRAYLAVAGALR